jgi:O-antigen ligase
MNAPRSEAGPRGHAMPVMSAGSYGRVSLLLTLSVVAISFVNPPLLPPIAEFGELTIRWGDACVTILLLMIFARAALTRTLPITAEGSKIFWPLLPFAVVAAMSLLFVWLWNDALLAGSTAAYGRLVTTGMFGLVLHMVIDREQRLILFTRILVTLSIASVGVGGIQAWLLFGSALGSTESIRVGGALGINSLGLVAGLLAVYGVVGLQERVSARYLGLVLVGAYGLILTNSTSSALATVAAVVISMVPRRHGSSSIYRLVRWQMPVLVVVVLAITIVYMLRASNVEGLLSVTSGTFIHRIMIGIAGLLIFAEYPFFGVGWQAAGRDPVIGAEQLNANLMKMFPDLPAHYFFLEDASSLHNLYLQILAESGIVGFVLFIFAVIRIGKVVAAAVDAASDTRYRRLARFYALGLVVLLVWFNTTPLFGGQIESILAVSFLGVIASISRQVARARAVPYVGQSEAAELKLSVTRPTL